MNEVLATWSEVLIGFVFASVALSLWRISRSLESIYRILESGIVRVNDVNRASVYSEHLGAKLRSANAGKSQPVSTDEGSAKT